MSEIETYEPGPGTQWFVSAEDGAVVKKLREAVACDDVAEAKAIIDSLEEGYYKRMILNAGGYEDAAADPADYIKIGCDHIMPYFPFDPEEKGILAISRSKEMVELLATNGADVFIENNRKNKAREYAWETMDRLGADPEAVAAVIALHYAKEAEILRKCCVDLPVVLEFLNNMLGNGNAFSESLQEASARALPGPNL